MNKQNRLRLFLLMPIKIVSISLFAFLISVTDADAFVLILTVSFFAVLHLRAQIASLIVVVTVLQTCIMLPFLVTLPLYNLLMWTWALVVGVFIFYLKSPLFISKDQLPKILQNVFGRYWRYFFGLGFCFILLTVLFRNFNLYQMFFYALFLFYVAEIMRQYGEILPHTFSLGNTLLTTLLLLASSLLALLLCEIASRYLFEKTPSKGVYLPHKEYIYITKKNTVAQNCVKIDGGKTKTVVFETSEQGLRNPKLGKKAPNEYRIAIIGDSFTMGWAVEDANTFSVLLEKKLNKNSPKKKLTVINGGMNGAGPLQEIGILQEYLLPLEPDLVIWQIYPENDVGNAYESATGKPLASYNEDWYVNFRTLKEQGRWRYRMALWLSQHSALYRVFAKISSGIKSPFVALIENLRFVRRDGPSRMPLNADRFFFLETDLQEYYPELLQGIAAMDNYIAEMKKLCNKHGIGFFSFTLPHHQVLWNWEKSISNSPHGFYKRAHGIRTVEALLAKHKIENISLYDVWLGRNDIPELYYINDGHLTAKGNAEVVDELYNYLVEVYFPAQQPTLWTQEK